MTESVTCSPARSRSSSAGPDSAGSDDDECLPPLDPDLVIFTSYLKYRDNKRWKTRYGVLTKISPAAGTRDLSDAIIREKATAVVSRYPVDLGKDLFDEIMNLKSVYVATFGQNLLPPLELLNAIKVSNLEALFPNLVVSLQIFATIPATVARAEHSFSVLNRVKIVLRSSMCQGRLSSLGVLTVETGIVRKANLDKVTDEFALKKDRSAFL